MKMMLSISLLPLLLLLSSSSDAFVLDRTALSTGAQRSGTALASSPGTEEWAEFNVEGGSAFDPTRMKVIAEDYSSEVPKGMVVYTENPGQTFSGTIVSHAEVVMSLGPEPNIPAGAGPGGMGVDLEFFMDEGSGSSGNAGPTRQGSSKWNLAADEYIVNRGTKIDKTRMYVVDFEPSATRPGGTVLRTLAPGKIDMETYATVALAEVIASSGPDGNWEEDKSPGANFRSLGGLNPNAGYTYGPTEPSEGGESK